MYGKTN